MTNPFSSTAGQFGIMAVVTAIVAGYQHLSSIFNRIFGILIGQIKISYNFENPDASFHKDIKYFNKTSFKNYRMLNTFLYKKNLYKIVAFETKENITELAFYKFRPIIVTNHSNVEYTVRYIRGTFNYEEFVKNLAENSQASTLNNFFVQKFIGSYKTDRKNGQLVGKDNSAAEEPSSNHSNTVYNKPLGYTLEDIREPLIKDNKYFMSLNKEAIIALEEIDFWYKSKNFYKQREIPWRRGLLLYGPPGTGKSLFAKTIGKKLNIPIYLFDISTMNNKEFSEFYNIATGRDCGIVLIEDIDAVFEKRKNLIDPKGGVTFDCILNTLSGVTNNSGILFIISTNNIDSLDEALCRPGRIDRKVYMGYLDIEGKRKIAERVLSECPEIIESVITDEEETGAQFTEKCLNIAIREHWNKYGSIS